MAHTPSSFPKFNSLPPEIRHMIWEAALPGPRIILIEASNRTFYSCYRVRSDITVDALDADGFLALFTAGWEAREPHDRIKMQDHFCFTTRAPPPVLLYVCRKPFEVASKHHRRVFGTAYSPPKVSFNFEGDTLYLDWNLHQLWNAYAPRDFSWVELAKVRYLAIVWNEIYAEELNLDGKEEFLAMVLSYFLNLERLTISNVDAFPSFSNSGDLVFMHLLLQEAEMYYHLKNFYSLYDDYDLLDWWINSYETGEELFDLKKLERCRKEHMAKKGNGGENEELLPLLEIDC
jgi:hypothetical protein